MNKAIIWFFVVGIFFLTTACAQQDLEPILQSAATQIDTLGEEAIQLQQEGIGPLEITPDPEGEERALEPPASKVEGNISSSGKRTTGGAKSDDPGYVESVAPDSFAPNQQESFTVEWLTYHDQVYGFSIDYPSTYLILPESTDTAEDVPVKVHQVRFQDFQLATGDTAEFELPNFIVEIFDLGGISLEDFSVMNEPDGQVEAYQLNNLAGLRVYYNQLIAPNEFYFFSSEDLAYKLTPLGPFGQEMLQSFRFE